MCVCVCVKLSCLQMVRRLEQRPVARLLEWLRQMVVAWIRVEAMVMKINGPFQANTLKAESCGFSHSKYEAWRERMLRKTEAPGRLLHPQPKEYPCHSLRWEEHGIMFSCILLVEGRSRRGRGGSL